MTTGGKTGAKIAEWIAEKIAVKTGRPIGGKIAGRMRAVNSEDSIEPIRWPVSMASKGEIMPEWSKWIDRTDRNGWTVLIARNDRTDQIDQTGQIDWTDQTDQIDRRDQTDRTIPDTTSSHFHEGSLRNSGVARDKREKGDWRDV